MKNIVLGIGLTLSLLSANSFMDKLLRELSYEPKDFQIGDGTKFKISNEDKAIILNGNVRCNDGKGDFTIQPSPTNMCTRFKNEDNSKFKVTLFILDKSNETEWINEEWTLKRVDNKMQLLRPNGFQVELDK